jgi:toxin ParE1/3/4
VPKVTVTPIAREDIKGIGRYTQKNWGVRKRNLYLGALDKAIKGLADKRRLDRSRSNIKPGLRSCSCQEHVIFFKCDDQDNVAVLRVLGQTMDFARHL